jgi:hypothetical protein
MYNKLFGKILDSSIWLEDHATIRVWITLLASMDEDGFCQFAAPGNLARRAAVTLEEVDSAVAKLEGPDPDSNDPDNEGRRIERVQGGWIVLNAVKYREMVTRQVIKEGNRLRMQNFRAETKAKKEGRLVAEPSVKATRRRRSGPNPTLGINTDSTSTQMTDEEAAELRRKLATK